MKKWYIIMYDIREEKRLKQIAKVIKGYGTRIQYSVFRCNLSKKELERLQWELSKVLNKEDSFIVVGLCENCAKLVKSKYHPEKWQMDDQSWIIY